MADSQDDKWQAGGYWLLAIGYWLSAIREALLFAILEALDRLQAAGGDGLGGGGGG
jgi:hypothetical protein